MNTLFFIGNGFDLSLGLKTSYNDFYKYYTNQLSKNDSIKELKKSISSDLKNWSDLELALGKYTERINSLEEFDSVFEDLSNALSTYLSLEYANFNFGKIEAENILDCLYFPENSLPEADKIELIAYKNKWIKSDWNVDVITFNYTETLE
jgi:hypothetical protein